MFQGLILFFLISGVAFTCNSHGVSEVFDSGWAPPPGSIQQSNKIVVHFNTVPTEEQVKAVGRSLEHMFAADPKLQIKFVLHGKILQQLQAQTLLPWMQKFLDQARGQGAQFLICNNTLLTLKIKKQDLYKVTPEDMVQAGILEVARLQNKGFSYIRYF